MCVGAAWHWPMVRTYIHDDDDEIAYVMNYIMETNVF